MAASFEKTTPVVLILEDEITLKGLGRTPLKPTGVLDVFESFDVTPVIGREFPNASLKDFLSAPNSDDLLLSQRGVVFFRKQDGLDDNLQKELVQRLGELSGKPETSGLHIHPVVNSGREHSVTDDEISVVSSQQRQMLYPDRNSRRQTARHEWHSDIAFEAIPSDYTLLRMTELPKTGGVTLPRGTALKSTLVLAVPPVIRTNPVTGWKSVFAVGNLVQKINGVTDEESAHLLNWFVSLIIENHDLQVRHRWQNPNDLAIWDNRSVYHAATWDHEDLGPRTGHRAVGLGERPYLDPNSTLAVARHWPGIHRDRDVFP
ncbi:hypothetical protein N7449_005572 [Penicillium cf. viridicatum]|uniref:TauD/TfdA-like domain-containing protein n=1 Tax=Penicillium cf. viridicatum TaxID=2972119 RepID=A0A9W9SZ43_9EURO|nr:hypothetical protein N7449_005572 [Penicillium cf. viridicatum]